LPVPRLIRFLSFFGGVVNGGLYEIP